MLLDEVGVSIHCPMNLQMHTEFSGIISFILTEISDEERFISENPSK